MSSGLHCLSHTLALTKYFLDGHYKKEVNESNKLGKGGKLAITFAKQLRELWFEENSFCNPQNFKKVLGQINALFAGNHQQDS